MSCRLLRATIKPQSQQQGICRAILLIKRMRTRTRNFKFTCINPTGVLQERSKTRSLELDRARMVYVGSASSPSPRRAWKRCHGPTSAASAKSDRQPDPGDLCLESGGAMPQYNFLCRACKKEFLKIMTLPEHEKGVTVCPHCKSKDVEQRWAAFFAVTSKKS